MTTEHVRCAICASLVPEPDNPKDPNAVMVQIEGQCIGYLSSDDAAAYLPGLKRLLLNGPIQLEGVIAGGGRRGDGRGSLGVFLDHNPQDFGIPRTGYRYGSSRMRTGFSQAVASDLEDDSYDLYWHADLSGDHSVAVRQLRLLLDAERDPIDRHYMLSELVKRLYKCRDEDPTALDEFDQACRDHHSEMVTIRPALLEKFEALPVIDTYRQAVIRCQKAKDWAAMRAWAERGIQVYGNNAARPEVIDELHKRLALAMAKIEGAASPRSSRRSRSTAVRAAATLETLVCAQCGATFERVRTRGRKPRLCPECRRLATDD